VLNGNFNIYNILNQIKPIIYKNITIDLSLENNFFKAFKMKTKLRVSELLKVESEVESNLLIL